MHDQSGSPAAGEWPNGPGSVDSGITEAELTELALAADPDAPMPDDAIPMADYLDESPGLLPSWYMPSPMIRRGKGWRVPVVLVIVPSFSYADRVGRTMSASCAVSVRNIS